MLFRAPGACSYVNSCKATGPLTAIINGNYGTKIDRLLFQLAQHYSVLSSSLRRERNHRLGLVTVPLDVNTREDFIHRLVDITETTHLITTQNLYRSLKHSSLSFIDIDTLPSAPLDMTKLPALVETDLAELVFTSGTTGQPKGVMLSHRNVVFDAQASVGAVQINSQDRALSILPLSHMFELTIEMALLYAGASIVYARSLVPDTLFRLLATQHVTVMVLVPQALQLFLNGVEREVRKQNKEKLWEILHTIAARLPFKYRRHLFGYLDKHHNLYLKGRKKNMIVLANGMNVYPEDVENTLQQQETVKDAVVFGLHYFLTEKIERLCMLYLVATPIGNLDDITLRALEVLRAVDLVASEDTRKTGMLLKHYGIQKPQLSFHEHNEHRAGERIEELLKQGQAVAVVTDAGTPGISDPGFTLVRRAIAANLEVTMIPGATAFVMALVLSGLPVHSFTFRGFPPRKPVGRRKFFEVDKEAPHTLIYYESPYRLDGFLKDALEVFGDRPAALANDLTKLFEKIERGTISSLLAALPQNSKLKGEYIVVIEGVTRDRDRDNKERNTDEDQE